MPTDTSNTSPPIINRFTYFRGRVALAEILKALGVGQGHRVALQAFTCVAVPEGILAAGAEPRYIDVEARGVNMDPADLLSKLDQRVGAIVVQHSFGIPANLDALGRIAGERGIPMIEDCAYTVASSWNGRQVGTVGTASFYSFEAGKPVFAGLGGSANINDDRLRTVVARQYERLHQPSAFTQLQVSAMDLAFRIVYRPSLYWRIRAAYRAVGALRLVKANYNELAPDKAPATDFELQMGRSQQRLLDARLGAIPHQTAHRRWVAGEYRRRINTVALRHFEIPSQADTVFGRYPLRTTNRSELVAAAQRARVEVTDFYNTPVHPLSGDALRSIGYEPGSCPNAEVRCQEVISLPTSPSVDERAIERTAAFLNTFSE